MQVVAADIRRQILESKLDEPSTQPPGESSTEPPDEPSTEPPDEPPQ
jgi:hypothetical protein